MSWPPVGLDRLTNSISTVCFAVANRRLRKEFPGGNLVEECLMALPGSRNSASIPNDLPSAKTTFNFLSKDRLSILSLSIVSLALRAPHGILDENLLTGAMKLNHIKLFL